MSNKKNTDYESVKETISTPEGLGLVCFNKHHHKGPLNCNRLSEILKIPIARLKECAAKLEELGVAKVSKKGNDIEVDFIIEDDKLKHLIDEVIWDHKQEYGKFYKKIITAELLDFMDTR